jgi:hypothetical protein
MTMITYTVFPGPQAHRGIDKKEITSTWDAFCMRVAAAQEYPDKGSQPLIKLAMFSNHRTAAHSLRHDANVTWVTGIEGDYDRGEVRMEQAVEMLERAGVRAVLHSSASSTPEKPRWRVLCPLSDKRTPDSRAALVARLNGVLGGILANESFTLSQSYYVGRVPGGVYTTAVTFEDADEGSFAGSIWAQQTKNLPFCHLQRDVVEYQLALIRFTDLRYINHDLKLRKI